MTAPQNFAFLYRSSINSRRYEKNYYSHCISLDVTLSAQQEQPIKETTINFSAGYNFRILDTKPFHGFIADITMHNPRPWKPSFNFVLTVNSHSIDGVMSDPYNVIPYCDQLRGRFSIMTLEVTGMTGVNGHFIEMGPGLVNMRYMNVPIDVTRPYFTFHAGYKYQPYKRGIYVRAGLKVLHLSLRDGYMPEINVGFSI